MPDASIVMQVTLAGIVTADAYHELREVPLLANTIASPGDDWPGNRTAENIPNAAVTRLGPRALFARLQQLLRAVLQRDHLRPLVVKCAQRPLSPGEQFIGIVRRELILFRRRPASAVS